MKLRTMNFDTEAQQKAATAALRSMNLVVWPVTPSSVKTNATPYQIEIALAKITVPKRDAA
jgi:hypothetical protein